MNKKFTYKNESFKCQHCGALNEPAKRYIRDHCSDCLHSLHLDVYPGDRASDCGGLMKPIAFKVGGKTDYKILYKCQKCSYKHWNMMLLDDNMQVMEKLNPYYEA